MLNNNLVINKFSYKYIKRLIDISLSLTLFILFIPIFIIIGLLIKLDSKGPVFYRWNVIGLNGVPFSSWKFRTMIPDADVIKKTLSDQNEMDGPVFKIKRDPRITRLGKILRKYSFDESIQLVSIIKGDMSLVGPRPPLQFEWETFEEKHKQKMLVKPGLTGLWQISGRNQINDFEDIFSIDLKYIEEWSIWLDMKILFRTIPAVIKGTGY